MVRNVWKNACVKALSYTPSPSLKNISTILKNGQDKVAVEKAASSAFNKESSKYGITRGAPITKEVTVHDPSVNHR